MNMITILIALFSLMTPMNFDSSFDNSKAGTTVEEDREDQNQNRAPLEWWLEEGG